MTFLNKPIGFLSKMRHCCGGQLRGSPYQTGEPQSESGDRKGQRELARLANCAVAPVAHGFFVEGHIIRYPS